MNTLKLIPLSWPFTKTIIVPSSKSYMNRALLIGALTKGETIIKNPLFCDDTRAMMNCLKKLGIEIKENKDKIKITGNIERIENKEYILDCDLSGITLRFLLAVAVVIPGTEIITGREGLCKRPIKNLVDALRLLGGKIEYLQQEGYPPVKIFSTKKTIHEVTIDGSLSSQFISALLLISPLLEQFHISVTGDQVSKPYIDMTIDIIKHFGVEVKNNNYTTYKIINQTYIPATYSIESDFSSAGYFAAIATLTCSQITIKNISLNSLQADKHFFEILTKMGTEIIEKNSDVIVVGHGVKPLKVDMTMCPDQVQTLAVLAAFAKGKTIISGIQSLRVKETNRVVALEQELKKMGIQTSSTETTLVIVGGKPNAATIDTYGDHRMAMSFAVAGSKLSGMNINNPEVITKTFPNFWELLEQLGIYHSSLHSKSTSYKVAARGVSETNDVAISKNNRLVLIGFMGAGKTTIAKELSKILDYQTIEMDELVLKKSNEKSINEIFEKHGEEYFRKLETETAKDLKNTKNIIISSGGGVVTKKETIQTLRENSTIIFLDTSFVELSKRLKDATDRPLWKDIKKAKELFEKRQNLYKQYADITIITNDKTIKDIVNEIIKEIGGHI